MSFVCCCLAQQKKKKNPTVINSTRNCAVYWNKKNFIWETVVSWIPSLTDCVLVSLVLQGIPIDVHQLNFVFSEVHFYAVRFQRQFEKKGEKHPDYEHLHKRFAERSFTFIYKNPSSIKKEKWFCAMWFVCHRQLALMPSRNSLNLMHPQNIYQTSDNSVFHRLYSQVMHTLFNLSVESVHNCSTHFQAENIRKSTNGSK